jgi:hypothetical protein
MQSLLNQILVQFSDAIAKAKKEQEILKKNHM